MTLDCPQCRRPVAVARRQCLYCGAAVAAAAATSAAVAAPASPAAAAPSLLPGSAPADGHLVVVSLDGVDATALSAAFGISAYEARQWSRRGGYHLHRGAPAADAEADRARLAASGIAAFVLDEAEVRDAAAPEPVLGGRLEGTTLVLRTPHRPIEVGAHELLLVAKGPIVRELPPLENLRWSRTANLDPGFRFHLHRLHPARPLEIDPAAFDFGAHRAGESSLMEIAGWMAALGAVVPVDDGFRRLAPALAPAAPSDGAAARLEDALRGSTRAAAILDNVAQFRFYSAWRGAVERLARPRSAG